MEYGIYKITNLLNGKCYIGSSANRARQGLRGRLRDHRTNLNGNRHHNNHLQHAWNRYGEQAFSFEILLFCDPESCVMYEQIAIDYFKPEYNVLPTAGSSLGFKHSPETIRRFKKTRNTPEFKAAASARMKGNKRCVGRKLSEETKEKLRQARLRRVGK